MKILFLDDDLERHAAIDKAFQDVSHAANLRDFAQLLKVIKFDVVMLDHDLEDFHYGCYDEVHERTGLDAAKMLTALPIEWRPREVIVHSWNPVGARRMLDELRDGGYQPCYQPFDYTVGE